jgi:hypothetical protein
MLSATCDRTKSFSLPPASADDTASNKRRASWAHLFSGLFAGPLAVGFRFGGAAWEMILGRRENAIVSAAIVFVVFDGSRSAMQSLMRTWSCCLVGSSFAAMVVGCDMVVVVVVVAIKGSKEVSFLFFFVGRIFFRVVCSLRGLVERAWRVFAGPGKLVADLEWRSVSQLNISATDATNSFSLSSLPSLSKY